MIPVFSQRDPRWKDLAINGTTSTLDLYGCLVTSIAMLYSGSDNKYTPDVTLGFLEAAQAFIQDLVLWKNVPYFRWRFYCATTIAPVEDLVNELRTGRPVLLNVHLGSGDAYKPNHWVLAVDETFTIHDPWYGDLVNLRDRYGSPEKAILGGAYFNTMPVVDHEFPKTITVVSPVYRRAAADTAAEVYGAYKKNDTFTAVGRVEGKSVEGNNVWYEVFYDTEKKTGGGFVWSGACR